MKGQRKGAKSVKKRVPSTESTTIPQKLEVHCYL